MTPALSDPAVWRTPYSYRGYLFMLQPSTVFAARIDQASFAYPVAQVTYDNVTAGAFGDIEPGMTVLFGSTTGADDLGRQRIRTDADATTVYIGASSKGDRDGEVTLADDAYITVLNDFRVWAKIPRIDDDGTMYKDYDISLGTNGSQPPPVASAGDGYVEFVDGGSIITVAFDGANSFAVADGAAISTYLWDVDDGAITVGDSGTAQITATFPPGFRWVKLTVTDDNAKTHTTRVPVQAAEPTGSNAPITEFRVAQQRHTLEGQQFTFSVREDILESTYPDGTLIMYWEDEFYDGVKGGLAGPTGREHIKFIGWHQSDLATIQASGMLGNVPTTELRCLDAAGKLDTLPGFPQVLENAAAPSDWTQIISFDIDRYLWYLLHWHSTALEVTSFEWSGEGSNYPAIGVQSDGNSLYRQVDQRGKAIAHRLTSSQRGRLLVNVDPQLQDVADRTPTVIISLDTTDYSEVTFEHVKPPSVHWLRGSSIIADDTNVLAAFAIAPGPTPGQGASSAVVGQQLVQDQAELNARTGHDYARRNAQDKLFTVKLTRPGDAGIDPALMEWVEFDIDADADAQRGLNFSDERFLPIAVDTRHLMLAGSAVKVVTLVLERESSGPPAETVVVKHGASTLPPYSIVFPTLPPILVPPVVPLFLGRGTQNIAMFSDDGNIYRTSTFGNTAGPAWEQVSMGLDGGDIFQRVEVNPFSPFYVGTGNTVEAWVLSDNAIYFLQDIFEVDGTLVTTNQHAFPDTHTARTIHASFGQEGFVVVSDHRGTTPGDVGVWAIHSTNASTEPGSTWTETQVTAFRNVITGISGTSGPSPALFVSSKANGTAYIIAKTSSDSPSSVSAARYKTTDAGASWTPDFTVDTLALNGVELHIPYDLDGENTFYYSKADIATDNDFMRNVGSTDTTVSPSVAGTPYAPVGPGRWSISSYPYDRSIMTMVGWNKNFVGITHVAIFLTDDGGDSWTLLYGPFDSSEPNRYTKAGISGNDPDLLYFTGEDGAVGMSIDRGGIIYDMQGDIQDFSPGDIHWLVGG